LILSLLKLSNSYRCENFYYSTDSRCVYIYTQGHNIVVYYVDYDKFVVLQSALYRGVEFLGNISGTDVFIPSSYPPCSIGTTKLTGRIDSGKIQALRGIKRMYSPNNLSVTAYLSSDKSLSSSSAVSTVTAYQKTMTPNLKSDYVKLKITFDNGFEFLELDNGGK